MHSNNLFDAGRRYAEWMQSQALPFWSTAGLAPNQAFYERLLANGEPDTTANIRVRVQARQIYSFAMADHLDWFAGGSAISAALYAFMEKHARLDGRAGYGHLMNAQFALINNKIDLYDHAFYLLAMAWLYRVTEDRIYLTRAEEIINDLDEHFSSEYGGWSEGDYKTNCRRQNPHMHLFEAFMSLYECSGQAQWLARASAIFKLFKAHFFDAENQVVLEFFTEDWQPLANDTGKIIEPGHMVEWVWLLRWYEKLTQVDVDYWANALYIKAYEIGIAPSGLMYDSMMLDGAMTTQCKRSWPMTELIKANIAQARAGFSDCEAKAAQAVDLLFKYYLTVACDGSWLDQRGPEDEISCELAQASTLYHLMCACKELVDYCAVQNSQQHGQLNSNSQVNNNRKINNKSI